MPRTVSVPILSTHAIAEKVRLYSDFRVYQFFLFNPARFFLPHPLFSQCFHLATGVLKCE